MNLIRMAAVAVLATFSLAASSVDHPSKLDDKQLSQWAKEAKTAADHNRLADLYQKRAEALEAKAAEHENEANRLGSRQGYNPMAHKWPAMARGPVDMERSNAIQARRAARKALVLAARHRDLAAKAQV